MLNLEIPKIYKYWFYNPKYNISPYLWQFLWCSKFFKISSCLVLYGRISLCKSDFLNLTAPKQLQSCKVKCEKFLEMVRSEVSFSTCFCKRKTLQMVLCNRVTINSILGTLCAFNYNCWPDKHNAKHYIEEKNKAPANLTF